MCLKGISQVGYNEADLGPSYYACTLARSIVLDCSHPIVYSPNHWYTRPPAALPPATNLLRIYSPVCWIMIFVSIFSVSVFLLMGKYYATGNSSYEEVVLVPFRYAFTLYKPSKFKYLFHSYIF